jgi:hypothetical protein
MTPNGLSLREIEQIQLAAERSGQQMKEVDSSVAKLTPEIWTTAEIVREYFDALKTAFKDDERSILSEDQLIEVFVKTVGLIRR